jgi:hypothetical protein
MSHAAELSEVLARVVDRAPGWGVREFAPKSSAPQAGAATRSDNRLFDGMWVLNRHRVHRIGEDGRVTLIVSIGPTSSSRERAGNLSAGVRLSVLRTDEPRKRRLRRSCSGSAT